MRVEIEEIVALTAYKVMGAAGAAPGNANRLGVSKGSFESFMVDWRYTVRAQANTQKDEGGLYGGFKGVGGCDGPESILIYVRRVLGDIDP